MYTKSTMLRSHFEHFSFQTATITNKTVIAVRGSCIACMVACLMGCGVTLHREGKKCLMDDPTLLES